MSLILNIETSGPVCSVAIGNNGELVSIKETEIPNAHASNIGLFIEDVINQAGYKLSALDAVSVSAGPGSYTGLRIGVSMAKGICYTLDKPLIAIPTLLAIARQTALAVGDKNALYAPMIDARRMEVYTALYDYHGNALTKTIPVVVDEHLYADILSKKTVWFSGNGSEKCKEIMTNKNAQFVDMFAFSAKNMLHLSQEFYNRMDFSNISYFEPIYLKLFNEIL